MLYLGIIREDNGRIVSHRSLLKVLVNPLFRLIGLQIATIVNRNKFGIAVGLGRPTIGRCPRVWKTSFRFNLGYDHCEKRRCII